MDIEKEILKQVIGALIDQDIGIYPKSISGQYDKRSNYMEGWNNAIIEMTNALINTLTDLGIEVIDSDTCLDSPIINIKSKG